MAVVLTQKKTVDDVLKWVAHPAFNFAEITLNNGDVALAVGDKLVGRLAWNSSGSTWKILDDGDSISATSVICPIVDDRTLLTAAAGDAAGIATRCRILRRGPALVHGDELTFDADVVQATVKAAMAALGIILVYETGLEWSPSSL